MNLSETDPIPRKLSELLNDLSTHALGEKITVAQVLEAFHERGLGFVILLVALPAAIPMPALGINLIIGLPLLILTGQQIVGRHTVWVPEKWRGKSMSSGKARKMIDAANPWVRRLEFFIRPRLGFITQGVFSHLIGIFGFAFALAVCVPLPLTNTVPSFAIALMAVGVLMRDGLAVLGGMFVGTVWIGALVFLGQAGVRALLS